MAASARTRSRRRPPLGAESAAAPAARSAPAVPAGAADLDLFRRPATGDRRPATEYHAVDRAGPGGAPDLDPLIHERLRLGMVSALAVNESLSFGALKELLGTTDGNLSVHARRLEAAGYVVSAKHFVGRTPKTEYRLTPSGRTALERYLDAMEALIRAARGG